MDRKYDLVVFGASGFTGQFVVEEMAKLIKDKKVGTFTWAVAGRSKSKIQKVLETATEVTGHDVKNIDIIEVDISNEPSIHEMAKQAKVVLNCVGPYRFFGEQVVKACIAEGAHHVDISGEPQFLERMQLHYHKEAEKNGVYVVGACGFDSIPTDMGVVFLKDKFEGDLNSVEMYLQFDKSALAKGSPIHYGTWQSAIYGVAKQGELRPLRQQLFPEPLPKPKFKLAPRSPIHYNDITKGWSVPFLGADKSIVARTERYFYSETKQRPVQINTYFTVGSLVSSVLLIFGAVMFGLTAMFKCGRYLLEKYPRLCSLGYVSHEGPTREQADTAFSFTLIGEGWSEKLSEPTDQHTEPPNKKMVVQVRGRNPGYGATCVAMIQSALTILNERNKMPKKGGVYTTGGAFAKTTLIQRLNDTGLTFTVEN